MFLTLLRKKNWKGIEFYSVQRSEISFRLCYGLLVSNHRQHYRSSTCFLTSWNFLLLPLTVLPPAAKCIPIDHLDPHIEVWWSISFVLLPLFVTTISFIAVVLRQKKKQRNWRLRNCYVQLPGDGISSMLSVTLTKKLGAGWCFSIPFVTWKL